MTATIMAKAPLQLSGKFVGSDCLLEGPPGHGTFFFYAGAPPLFAVTWVVLECENRLAHRIMVEHGRLQMFVNGAQSPALDVSCGFVDRHLSRSRSVFAMSDLLIDPRLGGMVMVKAPSRYAECLSSFTVEAVIGWVEP